MRPPEPFGEHGKLLSAFRKHAGEEAILASPSQGENRAVVRLFDSDWNGIDESALIVYYPDASMKILRYSILTMDADDWILVLDEVGFGSEFLWVQTADLTGRWETHLLICWRIEGAEEVLSVLNPFRNIGAIRGENFTVVNIDGKRNAEIFYIKREITHGVTRLWGEIDYLNEGELIQKARVSLDSEVSAYGKLQTNGSRLLLNAFKGAEHMITELLEWDGESLSNLTIDPITLTNTATLRTANLMPKELNGDGLLDIPAYTEKQRVLFSPETADTALQRISWYSWDKKGSELLFESIFSTQCDWFLRLDKVFLELDYSMKKDEFRAYSGKKLLFSLSQPGEKPAGMILTNGDKSVKLSITEQGISHGITPEKIDENLFWR
ncbi:MAG: hypothetical protein FWG82_03690 [Oscillospiraceae bacterium]|nr:hypothetical protein [Oscillospiraceae bacterium]